MGMRIGANITALTAQRTLASTKSALDRSMQKMSSGSRINKASDDAAGLAVSETLKAQMRGLKQANRNTQDGISLLQTGEGALSEVGNMLVRMRELSIQAASDTINDRDRQLTGKEYTQLMAEIDRISESTEFNGTKLLNGEGQSFDFQVNTKNSDMVDRISFEPAEADSSSVALGVRFSNVFDKESAQNSLQIIDNAIGHVSQLRAHFGSIQSRLNSTVENLNSSLESMATANSRIRDADIAEESSEMAKQNIMLQSGISVLAAANQQPGQALSLLNKG
ncbi:MAG: flagellin FliC [Bdellovibrionaceae bacterium]|nr:flagellin FliC [Bdellovibrio sp.]